MYVPKRLKLNQFRVVQIPSAKEIITRFGFAPGSNYSGEDTTAPRAMSKMDAAMNLDAKNSMSLDLESLESKE